jgi:acylphosphatase
MSKKRLHLKIFGEVQNVGFRYSLWEMAGELMLYGWVRNVKGGSVECEVEGEEELLKKILEWARRGPRWAKVEKVEERWSGCKNEFNKFEVKF